MAQEKIPSGGKAIDRGRGNMIQYKRTVEAVQSNMDAVGG